jgi:hypothetical protein
MENILEDDDSLEHEGGDPSGTRTPNSLLRRALSGNPANPIQQAFSKEQQALL